MLPFYRMAIHCKGAESYKKYAFSPPAKNVDTSSEKKNIKS